MDAPKPRPPASKIVPISVPEPKRPYIRRDHLTQKPFVDHEGLKALHEKMNESTTRVNQRIQRGEN